jgi:hypothetical protein
MTPRRRSESIASKTQGVPVASLEDVIRSKEGAGRPKDLLVILRSAPI